MRFVPNPKFAEEFALTPECRAFVNEAVDAVEENAKNLSDEDTGYYNDSFEREQTADGAVLGNTDFAAHILEFGSAEQPPKAPLGGGARAAGLRFEPTDK